VCRHVAAETALARTGSALGAARAKLEHGCGTARCPVIPSLWIAAACMLRGGARKIGELMTPDVEVIKPGDTLHTAAKMMADLDAGVLPVGENDRLVGMITDRDIAVRAIARGRDPDKTAVRDAMSDEVRYCFDDENPEEV